MHKWTIPLHRSSLAAYCKEDGTELRPALFLTASWTLYGGMCYCYSTIMYLPNLLERSLCSTMANMLDYNIVVNKFELHFCSAQSPGAVEYADCISTMV